MWNKVGWIFFILVVPSCLSSSPPEMVVVEFELRSISKNDLNRDVIILVKSVSGKRKIPMDVFFVDTGKRIFMLKDSSNVTILRGGNRIDEVEPDDIYVIHLRATDRYLDIYPYSHDLRILVRLKKYNF